MNRQRFVRALLLAGFVMVTSPPMTVSAAQALKFQGVLNDYTDTANSAGAWHITGTWSIFMKGNSGKADVIASIAMIRDGSGSSPHTHHLVLEDVPVTQLANGYSIRGAGTITTNGAAGFGGSVVTVTLTGSTDVLPSNVSFTFEGPAAGHFGAAPVDGAVTIE